MFADLIAQALELDVTVFMIESMNCSFKWFIQNTDSIWNEIRDSLSPKPCLFETVKKVCSMWMCVVWNLDLPRCHCHVSYSVNCVASLPFKNPPWCPHGIAKRPMDVHFRISPVLTAYCFMRTMNSTILGSQNV